MLLTVGFYLFVLASAFVLHHAPADLAPVLGGVLAVLSVGYLAAILGREFRP